MGKESKLLGKKNLISFTVVAILFLLIIFLIYQSNKGPDIAAYEQETVLITGLTAEDFNITPGQLAKMDCIQGDGVGKSAKAGIIKGYGPTLGSFLAEYGQERKNFSKIRFTSKDGYQKSLGEKMLKDGEVILSIANGMASLGENQRP
ncbi:MAG: hypothetical protein RR396_04910, partial [Clostridiales bacterium]